MNEVPTEGMVVRQNSPQGEIPQIPEPACEIFEPGSHAPVPEIPAWMNGSVRIGIHTSIATDIARSLEIAHRLGCNALQIFSTSPRMWARSAGCRIARADAERFRARRVELSLGPLVVHDNYLINLASPEPMLRVRSIQAFHDELRRAAALGADFLVVHPGASRGRSPEQAIAGFADCLRQAARGMRFNGLRILLENTSGMGTALGARLEELQVMLDAVADLPVGVCLDTAHLYQAGYDIRSETGLEQTLERIERTIRLRRVFLLHVNDSKTPLGSRVDRHAHIGKGRIGLAAFRRILNHPLLSASELTGLPGRAFILETPIDRPGDDRRNVRALWKLVGMKARQAPRAADGFSMVRRSARTRRSRAAKRRVRKALRRGK